MRITQICNNVTVLAKNFKKIYILKNNGEYESILLKDSIHNRIGIFNSWESAFQHGVKTLQDH